MDVTPARCGFRSAPSSPSAASSRCSQASRSCTHTFTTSEMERTAVSSDEQPELRLVRPVPAGDADASPHVEPETRDPSELVAELVAEAGLLPADRLEQIRAKALGGSFSQALVD